MIDIVGSINSSIELVKKLWSISEQVKNAEMRTLLADLQNQMVDLRIEAMRLKEENASLQISVKHKRSSASLTERMVVRDGVFWVDPLGTGEHAGPYCPNCKVKNTISILEILEPPFDDFGKYTCTACKGFFGG